MTIATMLLAGMLWHAPVMAPVVAPTAAPPARRTAATEPTKRPGQEGGVASNVCPCLGDLNGDGGVDAADLAILLGHWGTNGEGDLDGNFFVNGPDLSILLGAWGPCPSAPPNDHCDHAAPVDIGLFNEFCTFGADIDGPPLPSGECSNSGYSQIDHDVWFEYVAPDDGELQVSTCQIQWDTRIAVYGSVIPGLSACPTGGASLATLLGCNDDYAPCGLASAVSVMVNKNQHYKIRIGGFAGNQGTGTFGLAFWPMGTDCVTAIKIVNPASATVTGSTVERSMGFDYPNCSTGDGHSTWYWFSPPCSLAGANMTASLCNAGTDFDTVLTVWATPPGAECSVKSVIACNDDATQSGCQIGGQNRKSRVSFETQPGWTYFVQISGFLGASGNYELKLTLDACP